MKAEFDCIPCMIRQTIETARIAVDNKELQRKTINAILHYLQQAKFDVSPPELGKQIYKIIKDITGSEDPYYDLKFKFNKYALKHYAGFKRLIYLNENPILLAAKLAISGNLLEISADSDAAQLQKILDAANQIKFNINDLELFIDDLSRVKKILYLADNAGEIVFDKLFIEVLQRFYPERALKFTVAVRGAPIINDATMEDAQFINMEQVASVIDTGDDAPAMLLNNISDEMRSYYEDSEMVISKGQGNFETLHEESKLIYFLVKVRCPIIGAELGTPENSLVLKRNQ